MARVILVLVIIGVTVYSLIDCVRTDANDVRGLPKPVWLLVILFLVIVGPVMWLLLGRAQEPGNWGRPTPRTLAPDDDPEFLRSLGRPKRPRTKPEDQA